MNARTAPTALLLVMAMAAAVVACGEDDSPSGSDDMAGNGVDRAFVAEMIPHHRSAVEMAEIAKQRSERREIQQLADAIVSTQNAEIEQLQGFDEQLGDAGVRPGDLGMAEHEMGGDMDAAMLADARPFDREFIDAMIPHHQGAIRMARVELEQGENPEIKRLAEAIVDAQSEEIDEMNSWRVDWFGSLSPAGGVPAEDDEQSGGHGM
jgi:uncharacterized protein (DUF305 family)